MGLEAPPWVAEMFHVLTGDGWPAVDEDQLAALADVWFGIATELTRFAPEVRRSAEFVAGSGALAGQAQTLLQQTVDAVTGPDGVTLENVAAGFEEMGSYLRQVSLQTGYLKIMVIEELVVLAAEIAYLITMIPWTFGASAAGIAGLTALGQAFARQVLRQLAIAILVNEVLQVGMDAIAQLSQMAQGRRGIREWDTSLTKSTAITGLVGGLLGPVFQGLGQHPGKLLSKAFGVVMTRNVGHELGDWGAGVLKAGLHEWTTDGLSGFVQNGKWRPDTLSVSAGVIDQGVTGAAGIGRRKGGGRFWLDHLRLERLSAGTVPGRLPARSVPVESAGHGSSPKAALPALGSIAQVLRGQGTGAATATVVTYRTLAPLPAHTPVNPAQTRFFAPAPTGIVQVMSGDFVPPGEGPEQQHATGNRSRGQAVPEASQPERHQHLDAREERRAPATGLSAAPLPAALPPATPLPVAELVPGPGWFGRLASGTSTCPPVTAGSRDPAGASTSTIPPALATPSVPIADSLVNDSPADDSPADRPGNDFAPITVAEIHRLQDEYFKEQALSTTGGQRQDFAVAPPQLVDAGTWTRQIAFHRVLGHLATNNFGSPLSKMVSTTLDIAKRVDRTLTDATTLPVAEGWFGCPPYRYGYGYGYGYRYGCGLGAGYWVPNLIANLAVGLLIRRGIQSAWDWFRGDDDDGHWRDDRIQEDPGRWAEDEPCGGRCRWVDDEPWGGRGYYQDAEAEQRETERREEAERRETERREEAERRKAEREQAETERREEAERRKAERKQAEAERQEEAKRQEAERKLAEAEAALREEAERRETELREAARREIEAARRERAERREAERLEAEAARREKAERKQAERREKAERKLAERREKVERRKAEAEVARQEEAERRRKALRRQTEAEIDAIIRRADAHAARMQKARRRRMEAAFRGNTGPWWKSLCWRSSASQVGSQLDRRLTGAETSYRERTEATHRERAEAELRQVHAELRQVHAELRQLRQSRDEAAPRRSRP